MFGADVLCSVEADTLALTLLKRTDTGGSGGAWQRICRANS